MDVIDTSQNRLAVLIDADNAQPSITEGLLSEVAKYGSRKREAHLWRLDNPKLNRMEVRPAGALYPSGSAVSVYFGEECDRQCNDNRCNGLALYETL